MLETDRRGVTLIEVVAVLSVVAVLTAMAIPRLRDIRTRTLTAVMVSDLQRLTLLQEEYLTNGNAAYAAAAHDLGFQPSADVQVEVTSASAEGYAAVATHSGDPEIRCGVFSVPGIAVDVWPAFQPGRPACGREVPGGAPGAPPQRTVLR